MTPGFIFRAFLIQRARCCGSFGKRPAAIVVRVATCVRFGPMLPTIIGLPRIAWQREAAAAPTASFVPFAASPFASRLSSNVSPAGNGVCGTAYVGILSRGYAMKPACDDRPGRRDRCRRNRGCRDGALPA